MMGKFIDLTGQRFNRWTVLEYLGNSRYHCKCICGNEKIVKTAYLKNGTVKSCGCLKNRRAVNFIDITNQVFAKLKVSSFSSIKNGQTMWNCICECGNVVIINGSNLRQGYTKSCGCIQKEKIREITLKHNLRHTRLYSTWRNIKTRCYNKNSSDYKDYGGRNIEICNEWKDDFKAFYDWAIANGYDDSLSIDRIRNSEGYSPDNCRWVTDYIQANNKRTNVKLIHNGEEKTLSEWCNIYKVKYSTAKQRYYKRKSFEEIFEIKEEL